MDGIISGILSPEQEGWLARLSSLRVDQKKNSRMTQGVAPHKPLLLLVLSELVEQKRISGSLIQLSGDLAFRFSSYWTIVAERRRTKPELRMPFFHLRTSDFWHPLKKDGTEATSKADTAMAQINVALLVFMESPVFRLAARRTLIARYFEPAERAELYALFGMETPPEDVIAADARRFLLSDTDQKRRDAKFAVRVLTSYDYVCALSGYRMIDTRGNTVLEAAHIQQFKRGGPCHPTNGIALTGTAHWLFDRGYWSLDDDYTVLVAKERFDEKGDTSLLLKPREGAAIRLPENRHYWPDRAFLRWHRETIFTTKRF